MAGDLFERLTTLLESNHARFRIVEHPAEGKSHLVAGLRGTLPGQGAKAMLCKSREGDAWLLAVLSGDRKLDFKRVAHAMGVTRATLASPDEVLRETGCVIGAVPPFSFSARVPLVVDPALIEGHDEIAFNAGRLDRSIVLDSADYVRIAAPTLHPVAA